MGSIRELSSYSPVREAERIFQLLCEHTEQLSLPSSFADIKKNVVFKSHFDRVYFPMPFKETETASALKGIEGGVACALAELKTGQRDGKVTVDLEKSTSFLFQSYLATVGGLGKLDKGVRAKLKGIMADLSIFCRMLISPGLKIPIYCKHSQIHIDACLQISTRPKNLIDITTSMARSKQILR